MPDLDWLAEISAEVKTRREDHPSCNAGFLEVRNSLGDLFSALEPHTSVGDADPVSEPSQDWVVRGDDYGGRLTTTTMAGWGSLRLR